MKSTLYIAFILLFTLPAFANDLQQSRKKVIDLKGQWKFMIGDKKERSQENFNDSGWEEIMVPSTWENQGFPGYDGYAWYRKDVYISDAYKTQTLQLSLGYIDDVDEVFFNGVKIGQKGSFPPNYWTAYNAERNYNIPTELIHFNKKNVIAVRVYDSQLDGGIVHGNVAIYSKYYALAFDVNLEGLWKFKFGDNKSWQQATFNDSEWENIIVPGIWEDQISNSYDGFAWYRKQFKVDASSKNQRFVLMLGKIDDIDEVYINGNLVAKTGEMFDDAWKNHPNSEYNKQRFYYLNQGDIIPGQTNTIAIRVFDSGGPGGIYEGPVGLVELKRFVSFWRNKNNNW
jgi:sialate O-acetylesterase